jgi:uncharacterized protein (UPF0332 family)
MNEDEYIQKRIQEAEKAINELAKEKALKKLVNQESMQISKFYEDKSIRRLETAKLIFDASTKNQHYDDFSEAVSAAYYSMYYIVHAYLALNYKTKLAEGTRGIHAITTNLILYYLIKTGKLARHLFEEYCNALSTASEIQDLDWKDYQSNAYEYVKKYQTQRENREIFTYFVSKNAEKHHATNSIAVAEEFINTIRQLMHT